MVVEGRLEKEECLLILDRRIIEIDQAVTIGSPLLAQRQDTPKDIAKPVRPLEFRLVIAIPFVGLFILLAISLAVLFIKARPNGMYTPVLASSARTHFSVLSPGLNHSLISY
jgi:hypothetical protein